MAQILTGVLVLMLVLDSTLGTARTKRLLAAADAEPATRIRLYRVLISSGWFRATLAVLVAFTAGLSLPEIGLSPGNGLGFGAPDGVLFAWLFTALMAFSSSVGALRIRRRMRAGQAFPARERISALFPRTPHERRFAVALAITAGITEEILFRGALIALGRDAFGLHTLLAATLSLLLFVGIHAYQGRAGMLNATFLGLIFTGTTLVSGSLLPAVALHILIDVNALLLIPAKPTPQPAPPPAQPAAAPPPPKPTEPESPPTIRSPIPS